MNVETKLAQCDLQHGFMLILLNGKLPQEHGIGEINESTTMQELRVLVRIKG